MQSVINISLVGAGLVIVGLLLLWFMMELLVRSTGKKKESAHIKLEITDEKKEQETRHKQKAAAAATAVSIALLKSSFLLSEQRIDQGLTAWQSTNRHSQLHNRPDSALAQRKEK